MALRDKLNSLAATATSKANSAIETGKLRLKIDNEEKKITEFTLNIGELLVDQLDAGEIYDDEVMALYASILAARETIAGAKADIEANRQAEEAGEADFTTVPTCAACGASLGENAKFCSQCGTRVEDLDADPVCAGCGAPLEEDAKFCSQCGAPVPAPDADAEPAED